jgi:RHS repeat-associated protein
MQSRPPRFSRCPGAASEVSKSVLALPFEGSRSCQFSELFPAFLLCYHAFTSNRCVACRAFENTAVSGSRNTNDGFAGMPDSPSGNHAQFRDYSNVTGRWLQPDPYDGSYDLSYPQTLNRYAYVGNNPLGYTDPTGLTTRCLHSNVPTDTNGNPISTTSTPSPNCQNDDGGEWWDPVDWPSMFFGMFSHPSFHGSHVPRPNNALNNGVRPFDPSVSVFCRGIEHPIPYTNIPLGRIGAQHCDALVSQGGKLYSISAGPIPPDGPNQVLRQFVTEVNTVPTGALYYYRGRESGVLGACLISTATQMQNSSQAPAYNAISGPNSNNALNQVFGGCGVDLGLYTHGPFF